MTQSGVPKKKHQLYDEIMSSLQVIEQYTAGLGLKPQTMRLYIELAKHQPSVLHLAKSLHISRTQVYRHIETLMHYNLVSAEKLTNGTRYRALPLDNIESAIIQRENELGTMRTNLSSMTQLVREFVADKGQQSTVRHYYGLSGLKQANWNLTKARREYRVFETDSLVNHFAADQDFARRCNEQLFKNGLVSYDLTNQHPALEDMMPIDPERAYYRYIDPRVLKVDFELYIYNQVITLLDYDPNNMHAVEIEHPTLFRMMSQIYSLIWNLATPVSLAEQKS